MKFLATGNIRDPKGPKKIIVFAYTFFLVFILLNLLLEVLNTPLNKDEFFNSIETSLIIRLEKGHIQIFLFGFLLVFYFSTLIYAKFEDQRKEKVIIFTIFCFVLYIFSLIYYQISDWYYYFYWISTFLFHITLLVLQIFLYRDIKS
ncbi:MAG: hypothetical protein ACK4UJ_11555 [Leptonema sp. (in: bacteria)]